MAVVRMTAHFRGMMEGVPLPRYGETVELPDHAAQALVDAKIAEPADALDAPVADGALVTEVPEVPAVFQTEDPEPVVEVEAVAEAVVEPVKVPTKK